MGIVTAGLVDNTMSQWKLVTPGERNWYEFFGNNLTYLHLRKSLLHQESENPQYQNKVLLDLYINFVMQK
ncbi:MAG: hypothetical protein U5K75_02205 [Ahrensia sp.]|nr:hypothetical protein [Ahrensia sp.]